LSISKLFLGGKQWTEVVKSSSKELIIWKNSKSIFNFFYSLEIASYIHREDILHFITFLNEINFCKTLSFGWTQNYQSPTKIDMVFVKHMK
jgi:hypothetical protein